ncbi:choice-of-anchor L domain-containing protein [Haliea sp. E1-2-M8]|uniref:choice-of-anchor L family PEP-CTERM protein n=1 Tax=Haliea sp. E1-2-M8 TaxID=3064706 RepID=UPI0027164891|nr:choice-of-anchor L domain-containing protein [Haliea sp. E1-2-M8]MDO8862915.1 choice-of-anchor L domain-containing protein [Haliea sp. E1-2-M8]
MKTNVKNLTIALALILPAPAMAFIISPVNSDAAATLFAALLGPDSGINVDMTTLAFVGKTTVGEEQSATYTGMNLVPDDGVGATITNPDGILLTSGHANMPTTNTESNFSNSLSQPGTGSNAALSTLSGNNTFDQNFLSFDFTLAAGNAVSANFVFASDEFPTQTVTDIFGFFVDGVNNAFFPGGALVSNVPQANFQSNPVGSSRYPNEYNGFTPSLTVTGLLAPGLTTHNMLIAIADTFDSIFDSGVFIGNLRSTTASSGGIGDPAPVASVPVPATYALMAIGLALLGALRRRSAV